MIAVGSVNIRQLDEPDSVPMNELQINRRTAIGSVEHSALKTKSSDIEAALGSLANLWRPCSLGGCSASQGESESEWALQTKWLID